MNELLPRTSFSGPHPRSSELRPLTPVELRDVVVDEEQDGTERDIEPLESPHTFADTRPFLDSKHRSDIVIAPVTPSAPSSFHYARYLAAAVMAHLLWGIYPGLARYLQVTALIPTFSLISASNFCVEMALLAGLSARNVCKDGPQPVILVELMRTIKQHRLMRILPIVVVVRSITNVYAAKFTLSVYVQMVTLLTPFALLILNKLFLKQPLPPFTIISVILCLCGACLILFGADLASGTWRLSLQWYDWIGIGMAFVSMMCLAAFMMLVRASALKVDGETQVLIQCAALFLVCLTISLICAERWSVWLELSFPTWFVFLVFAVLVLLCGNLLQTTAIRVLGPPTVSSLLALRLVSALVFGATFLQERFTSILQLIGVGVVIVTVTVFLIKRRADAIREAAAQQRALERTPAPTS